MDFLEARFGDVRINLGGRQIGMAQQFLHDSQIRSPFEEMGRESVSQGVRVDMAVGDSGIEHPAHVARGEDFPAAIKKEGGAGRLGRHQLGTTLISPAFEGRHGGGVHRHLAFFATLTRDPQNSRGPLNVVQCQGA